MNNFFKQTSNQEISLRYLIVCIFAIPVFISVLFLIGMGIQGVITGSWTFSLNPKAGLIINYIENALFILLYFKILFSKNFTITKKAKAGLIILTIVVILSVLDKIFSSVINELIDNGHTEGDYTAITFYSLYQAFKFVLYIVGLWIFISGCKVEKALKRFVIATPFISSVAISIRMILMNSNISIFLTSYILPVIILVVVYHLSGINKQNL